MVHTLGISAPTLRIVRTNERVGAYTANIAVGGISAVLDNVPVMFAVLGMNPDMGKAEDMVLFQWLS